jgi:predicted PurR-regulated permease PerM
MPYAATLIVLTFVCGLLPVIGNLISNSLLCTLALSVAFPAAVVSLAFLLLVHKIEYFLSARIQGQEIGASAWELLIVLFAFEVVFGPAGMVAAPVFYAFAIAELRFVGWVDSLDFGPRLGPEDVICRD